MGNYLIKRKLLGLMHETGCKEGSLQIESKSQITKSGRIMWTAKVSVINEENTRVVYGNDTRFPKKKDAEYRAMQHAVITLLRQQLASLQMDTV